MGSTPGCPRNVITPPPEVPTYRATARASARSALDSYAECLSTEHDCVRAEVQTWLIRDRLDAWPEPSRNWTSRELHEGDQQKIYCYCSIHNG